MSKAGKDVDPKPKSKQPHERESGTVSPGGGDGPKSDKKIARPDQAR